MEIGQLIHLKQPHSANQNDNSRLFFIKKEEEEEKKHLLCWFCTLTNRSTILYICTNHKNMQNQTSHHIKCAVWSLFCWYLVQYVYICHWYQSKSQTSEAPSATTVSLNPSKLHVYNAGGKNYFFFPPCVKQPSLSFSEEKNIHHSIGSLVHFPSTLWTLNLFNLFFLQIKK